MTGVAERLVCALDAQIAVHVAGGTETALLSLLTALARHEGPEQFLVLAIPAHAEALRPYLGQNAGLMPWPDRYSWYIPDAVKPPMAKPWERMRRLSGPLAPLVEAVHGRYAHGRPLGRLAERLYRRAGPAAPLVPPLARLYHGLRARRAGARLTRRQADAQLRARGVAVIHFPYPHHFATSIPFVYEPWGLPHLHFPEQFAPGEPQWMDDLFRGGCTRASMVITATRCVKEDIVARYNVPRHKVAVIRRFPRTDVVDGNDAPLPAGLPERFAFFPAMTWPTKNHLMLFRALALLRDRDGVVVPLVCTGRPYKPHWPAIQEEVRRLKLGDQVRFLGAVSVGQLRALFRKATFLVFPSRFEGLGLPPIEAFQTGLPVVASNASCIPEVVGDAALLFDPLDADSIAAAILRAVREPALLDELRERGRARLAAFSPERMAQMFVTSYRQAAGRPLDAAQRDLLAEMTA